MNKPALHMLPLAREKRRVDIERININKGNLFKIRSIYVEVMVFCLYFVFLAYILSQYNRVTFIGIFFLPEVDLNLTTAPNNVFIIIKCCRPYVDCVMIIIQILN